MLQTNPGNPNRRRVHPAPHVPEPVMPYVQAFYQSPRNGPAVTARVQRLNALADAYEAAGDVPSANLTRAVASATQKAWHQVGRKLRADPRTTLKMRAP